MSNALKFLVRFHALTFPYGHSQLLFVCVGVDIRQLFIYFGVSRISNTASFLHKYIKTSILKTLIYHKPW